MGSTLFPCLETFAVFLYTLSFLAIATLWVLIVDNFGIKCFWVSFHQNAPNFASFLLVFFSVMAGITLASRPAWFTLSETVTVEFQTLSFFAIAYAFFSIFLFFLGFFRYFRWGSFEVIFSRWVQGFNVLGLELFGILFRVIIFLMIIILETTLFRAFMAASDFILLFVLKKEIFRRIFEVNLDDWILVK